MDWPFGWGKSTECEDSGGVRSSYSPGLYRIHPVIGHCQGSIVLKLG